jgi:hypothetical protein
MFRTIGLVLTFTLLLSFPVASVAAQTTTLADAGIVFGDCDTPDFEYSLSVPAELTGQPIGSDLAVPAGQSFSLVPVSLDALTSEESAIVVLDELALPVACGPIGGVPAPDGSVAVGIAPVDGSGVIGVAHLLPDGTDVIVSLFTTHLDAGVLDTTVTDVSDSGTNGAGTLDTIDTGSGVFSAAETAYATNLIFVMETMTASRDQANQLLDDPHPDEEQWNFDLILEVVTWGDLQDRLHELTPPPSFMEIHQLTVAAFALYDSAGDDLLRGIEANDSASLQSGFVKLDLADELIGDASELVNDLVDERQQ